MRIRLNSTLSNSLYLFTSTLFLLVSLSSVNIVLAHSWKAPKKAAEIPNPVKATAESIQQGQELYSEYCAGCHGAEGKGGDPAKFKGQMTPPNLVGRLSHHSDGDFFWKIQNGRGSMPGFSEDLEPSGIWSIINYLKSQ